MSIKISTICRYCELIQNSSERAGKISTTVDNKLTLSQNKMIDCDSLAYIHTKSCALFFLRIIFINIKNKKKMETKNYKIVVSTDPYHATRGYSHMGKWKIINSGHAEMVYDDDLSLGQAQRLLRQLYIDRSCDAFEQEVYDNMFNEDCTGSFQYDIFSYWIEEDDEEDDEDEDLF